MREGCRAGLLGRWGPERAGRTALAAWEPGPVIWPSPSPASHSQAKVTEEPGWGQPGGLRSPATRAVVQVHPSDGGEALIPCV